MIEELTKACVHCGFCLPTCPTYVLWSEEMDSPRGRIQLMEKTAQGTLTLNATVVEHFDRCLGCMACVTSCPSGVRYGTLIEETRAHIEENGFDRIRFAALFATRNDLRCPGYERERITCAGLKYPRIDVDVDIR